MFSGLLARFPHAEIAETWALVMANQVNQHRDQAILHIEVVAIGAGLCTFFSAIFLSISSNQAPRQSDLQDAVQADSCFPSRHRRGVGSTNGVSSYILPSRSIIRLKWEVILLTQASYSKRGDNAVAYK